MESQGFVGLKAGQKDGGLGHKRPRWVNALGGRSERLRGLFIPRDSRAETAGSPAPSGDPDADALMAAGTMWHRERLDRQACRLADLRRPADVGTVSYTHLTLPTKR